MQADAESFPALAPSLRKVLASGGPTSLFAGADTSALYAFVLGGVGFGANEFLRRYLSALAGPAQSTLYALQVGTRMDPHPDPMDPHPDPIDALRAADPDRLGHLRGAAVGRARRPP